jgi:hypothetical protein
VAFGIGQREQNLEPMRWDRRLCWRRHAASLSLKR